jgi:hypothetical protein
VNAVTLAAIRHHQVAVLHLSIFKCQLVDHDLLALVWRSEPLSVDVLVVTMPDQLSVCKLDFTSW